MPTATIPEVDCAAGVETHSPSVTSPAGVRALTLQLTSSEWTTKAGTGSLRWGVQISRDNGATWDWWLYQPALADPIRLMIGTVGGKSGALPAMSIGANYLLGAAGDRVRLAAVPTVAIKLGCIITIS